MRVSPPDSRSSRRRRRVWLPLFLLLAAACSEESDEHLVEKVGVTVLRLADPGLQPQNIEDPAAGIQVAQWTVSEATLILDGAFVDALFGGECTFGDTAKQLPSATPPCFEGIVIEASTSPITLDLVLTVSEMVVRRAEPIDLTQSIDFDGDGVVNDANGGGPFDAPCGKSGVVGPCDDNCPLVPNPDQTDDNADGIGNACTSGGLRDSDGDLDSDGVDNCVWVSNADQADGDSDGIGDACHPQEAEVVPFVLDLAPTTLEQQTGVTTFITVDFDDQVALDCDWDAGSCVLNPAAVQLCTSSFPSGAGCP